LFIQVITLHALNNPSRVKKEKLSLEDSGKHHQNHWYLLILTVLTMIFVRVVPMTCMPVLFKEISDDLGLNLVQVGAVWGIMPFASILVMPIGGILCDRFGIKRTLVFTCLLAGFAGALRGWSNDVISLLATSFLWGILVSANMPAMSMAASSSFSVKQQGLSQGFVALGGGIGYVLGPMISATLISPWLGGWRNVLFLYGSISIVFSLLWLVTVKEQERAKSANCISRVPLRQSFSHLLRTKSIWFLGLMWLGYLGCVQGMIGFLPLYLRGREWPATVADGALASFSIAATLSVIPLTILSDKIGSRKLGLFVGTVTATIGVGLLSVIYNEVVWVLIIVPGIFSAMIHALAVTMCLESRDIKAEYMGAGLGIMSAIANTGWVISPPIGNSLASISFGLPFVFWAVSGVCGLILLIFVKETGWRASRIK
jgi:MFS family permease